MKNELEHLKEAIRQKKALVEARECELRELRELLDKSVDWLIQLLEEAQCKCKN